jgi:hypothetical protein
MTEITYAMREAALQAFMDESNIGFMGSLEAAIKAALESRVLADAEKDAAPIAYLSTDPREWDRSRIKRQGNFTVPCYGAPPNYQALRTALERIANMTDRDGNAIEMHREELRGIAKAAILAAKEKK